MTGAGRAPLVHPIAVLLLPLPAIVCILFARDLRFGLLCLAVALLATALRDPRLALRVLLLAAAATGVLWTGFALSLHGADDRALVALRGAIRIVSIMLLYVATSAAVRWPVLRDTLVERYRMPYRVADVLGLGGRFAVLIRRDLRAAGSLARLRARGRPLRTARLLLKLAVPVLMASFRHADELSIAMDARGFGEHERRTVHDAVPPRLRDAVVLLLVWAASAAAAMLLA
ncbi:energy-coupling factor transporter transmembrane component T [Gulosibacter sp. 10]|uniref:energy-coupling factor transporter transmembrane component T n=1 Tax=Gulosibacter sp. 10 TaxID=1255570 RepID=UPI00097EB7A9|nr:energy-coupling factor transporter transmembrane component T [Gulosibacter sp. 10]SJM70725.1 Transmembrane component YkoC of energizing module of thiamin-regulated ECF transporter for HydroxyMethylPyrimidine [Gulosibacter sp. 10]